MKLMKMRFLPGIALLLAGTATYAGGSTGFVQVDTINTRSSGDLWLRTTLNTNPDACADSTWLVLKQAHPGFNLIASQLLTAKAVGLEVNITLKGCVGDSPKILGVALR